MSDPSDAVRPYPGVIRHPGNFGRATVEACGISTRVLVGQFHANDRDADLAAWWMGCRAEDVMTAVDYEESIRDRRGWLRRLFNF